MYRMPSSSFQIELSLPLQYSTDSERRSCMQSRSFFLTPVYVPPMAISGYSNNLAYPHMSNGNTYLLVPACSLSLSILTGSPMGFGRFTNPTGYAVNAPGVVGAAIELVFD